MTGQYPSSLLEKPLPSSEESERCIIGGVLLDNALFDQAKGTLQPSDFYSPVNRRYFAAMLRLANAGKPIEVSLLFEELKNEGPIEAIGGLSTITKLATDVPYFSDLTEYVQIVRNKSLARQVVRHLERVKSRILSEEDPIEDVLATEKNRTTALFDQADNLPGARSPSVLRVKTANEWIQDAKERPIPKKLCGDLWFENEIVIMFGPTGRGKTALAVQITESIGSGVAIDGFELGVKGKRVLYLDCELSDKQFEGRYANKLPDSDYYVSHYQFSENFYRAEIDLSSSFLESETDFQERLQQSIGAAIVEYQIDALVIDNVTWLRDETEKARAALPLMKGLVDLKARYNVSILVLAHTPKRDLTQPITLNHLQGSAVLSNFADSVFAISESVKDPGMRYLKQLKIRSAENVYGPENVKTCQLVKAANFLRFEFGGETSESEHLKQLTEKDLDERRQSIARLHGEKRSQREIARELGISVSTVNKYVKQLDSGCSPCSPDEERERTNTNTDSLDEQGRTGVNTCEQERTNGHSASDNAENAENIVRSFVRPANGANV